jgi:hypothetical protein
MRLQDQLIDRLAEEGDVVAGVLEGSVCFARRLLGSVGLPETAVTRVLCSPDARRWRLAFAEHVFDVEIGDDGFSVRCLDIPAHSRPPARRAS